MSLKNLKLVSTLIVGILFFTVSNAQIKEYDKEDSKTEIQKIDHKNYKPGEKKPWNEVCPVRGGKINNKVAAVQYNGKSYGFCCGGCDTKFKKDPQKYSKNLSDDGKKFVGKKS